MFVWVSFCVLLRNSVLSAKNITHKCKAYKVVLYKLRKLLKTIARTKLILCSLCPFCVLYVLFVSL